MKICPNGSLCSINTKLICRTNKSHGGKLICDRTKREIHKMYDGYLPEYLSIGAEFLYAPVRDGLKSLLFTSYN